MFGFAVAGIVLFLVVLLVLRVVNGFVSKFARTPLQYVMAWLMIPPVGLGVLTMLTLLVTAGGWAESPTMVELWRIVWCLVFLGVNGLAVWGLFTLGRFEVNRPVPQAGRVPVVYGPVVGDPYRVPGQAGADTGVSDRVGG